jgi:hypothetical protein
MNLSRTYENPYRTQPGIWAKHDSNSCFTQVRVQTSVEGVVICQVEVRIWAIVWWMLNIVE